MRPRFWVQKVCSNISSLLYLVYSSVLMRPFFLRHDITPTIIVPLPSLLNALECVLSHLLSFPQVSCCSYYTQTSTFASSGFGVSWPVGTLYVNMHTIRTMVRRPPRWTPFRKNASLPSLPLARLLLRVCVRRLGIATPRNP